MIATPIPTHIAIIMDGNGRWAKARGLPRYAGHHAGAEAVSRTVEACCELGVRVLTLYAFSWENWNRSPEEVGDLMGLLDVFLRRELPKLRRHQVRLQAIGRLKELPAAQRATLQEIIAQTASFDRMTLILAISYGGRQEIIDAVRRLAQRVQAGSLQPQEIDEERFSQQLDTAPWPDPDLLIRTSGEQRLSNFLLWQSSYTELYVTATLWPDFSKQDLVAAITDYARRERRFGRTQGGFCEVPSAHTPVLPSSDEAEADSSQDGVGTIR